jgi:hypothetical protein
LLAFDTSQHHSYFDNGGQEKGQEQSSQAAVCQDSLKPLYINITIIGTAVEQSCHFLCHFFSFSVLELR